MFAIVYNVVCVVGWGLFAVYGDPTPITWMVIGFHSGAVFFSSVIEFGYHRGAL